MKQIYLLLLTILLSSIYSLDAQTTGGKDFWLTFGKNWLDGTGSGNPNISPVVPRIRIVSNDFLTEGDIVFTHLPLSSPDRVIHFVIPAKEVFEIALNDNQRDASYLTSEGLSDLSIKITCDNPVSVYALNQCLKSADATNILPVPTLGTDYYQISYQPQGEDINGININQDAFAVIAIEDNTTVNLDGYPLATLNEGEVYYKTDENDMTGTHITSDKPVAFFALCQGTYISLTNTTSRDCLFQQLAQVNTWGKNFLVPVTNIFGNSTVERVRIVASQDNTTITRTGGTHISAPAGQTGPVYNLNTGIGQYIELEVSYTNNGCYIETNKPVGVCS
ncbi:MAG: IgGFc-binding protein, partial [Lentimicrobiaceae bacterium]|nr:IgGFc-binding protein [Lentimicrobiaceae bacterium]